MGNNNLLIVIVGPTAVGKTGLCVKVAGEFKCEIVSADSRQFYKEMSIGTAKPTVSEMGEVRHHFIDFLPIEEEMSAGRFEELALERLKKIFRDYSIAILTGGSGLYLQAVCHGMSEMPTPPKEVREELMEELQSRGLDKLLEELSQRDPKYFESVDKMNYQRVVRALEMIRFTGMPFSSFRKKKEITTRSFRILKIGLELDRQLLYRRINKRVDKMIEEGLMQEIKDLYPRRKLNSLQTVGYKEFFDHLEGKYDFEEAIRLVKRNTRRYAKRQMTWFKKDPEIMWFNPLETEKIIQYINDSKRKYGAL